MDKGGPVHIPVDKGGDDWGDGKWKQLRLILGCPSDYTQCSVRHGSLGKQGDPLDFCRWIKALCHVHAGNIMWFPKGEGWRDVTESKD